MSRSTGCVAAMVLVLGSLSGDLCSAEQGKGGFLTSPEGEAAQATAKELQRQIVERRRNRQEAPDSFGTDCCQILQIPAAAFQPVDGQTVPFGNPVFGYLYPSASSGPKEFWAPVQLPTGAHLVFLDLYFYDTEAASDLAIELTELGGTGGLTGPPSSHLLTTVSSTGSGGYGYAAMPVDYMVNNNVALDPAGAQLILVSTFSSNSGSQKFKAVDIWWHREVSPAPTQPTFLDVPPSDFGFQYIEALADSNITGGCGGGNYCPDSPVTRRQMAIFIAKALGLHWLH